MGRTVLIGILLVSGLLFVGSVLLMSPKGGLGMGIAGMSGMGEYGSKKSVENTLKKSALISAIIFVGSVIFLPYTQ